jgi:hydroxyacyl-ACP dehydratase HTD2-like protein with hotdog domain
MSRIQSIKPGELLPEREFKPDNVQLFLYNSALWNAHRIHFDLPYTKEVEGYPGLVIAGPLLGDWLTQSVTEWLGEHGVLTSIEYANRKAS